MRTMTEDERILLAWASDQLFELSDEHARALDLAGWKIVSKDGDGGRWPFDSQTARCTCPDWCEDLAEPPAPISVGG